jgi:imidazolonepropionase-like amidohydrolase
MNPQLPWFVSAAAGFAADHRGTCVDVHAFIPKAIRAAVDAGVKCREHGRFIDGDTAKRLAGRFSRKSRRPPGVRLGRLFRAVSETSWPVRARVATVRG